MSKREKRKSRESKRARSASVITMPRELRPALLHGEDRSTYDAVLADVAAAVQPRDVIEQLWVRDIADLAWEALRLRRLKVALLNSSRAEGLEKVLRPLIGPVEAMNLASDWDRQKPSAIEQVKRILEESHKSMTAVLAQTLATKLDEVERIERMLANAELRRHAVLREIDRHRETKAHPKVATRTLEHSRSSELSAH